MRLIIKTLAFLLLFSMVQCLNTQETFTRKKNKLTQKYKPFFTKDAQLIDIGHTYIFERKPDSSLVKKIINPDKLVKTHEIEYHKDFESMKHGKYTEWYDNGNLWVKGQYRLGNKQGLWKYFSHKDKGKPRKAGTFIDGKKEGAWTFQMRDKRVIINYKSGNKDGYEERYDSLKNLEYKALYRNDSLINVMVDKNSKNRKMAHFTGGDKELLKEVKRNLKYPSGTYAKNIEGTVKLKFVVEKDGSIGEIETLRGVCNALEKASVRTVEKLPKFNPAELNGKKVRSWYQIPITFKLKKE